MNKETTTNSKTSVLQRIAAGIGPLDIKKTGDRMALAANLDDLLQARRLSNKQFADMMGKDPSVISKWLGGTHNFTYDTLSEISFVLEISISELTSEKADPVVFRKNFAVKPKLSSYCVHDESDPSAQLSSMNAKGIMDRLINPCTTLGLWSNSHFLLAEAQYYYPSIKIEGRFVDFHGSITIVKSDEKNADTPTQKA